ncbi:MAG: hypothetical protein IIC80_10850, partial [Chloroflexi bacterium]|nr:hypothetical protein [Chloroflexota bacterium]
NISGPMLKLLSHSSISSLMLHRRRPEMLMSLSDRRNRYRPRRPEKLMSLSDRRNRYRPRWPEKLMSLSDRRNRYRPRRPEMLMWLSHPVLYWVELQ